MSSSHVCGDVSRELRAQGGLTAPPVPGHVPAPYNSSGVPCAAPSWQIYQFPPHPALTTTIQNYGACAVRTNDHVFCW